MEFPCLTPGCNAPAVDGGARCDACSEIYGYPKGWSRARDEAWLRGEPCSVIALIPVASRPSAQALNGKGEPQ